MVTWYKVQYISASFSYYIDVYIDYWRLYCRVIYNIIQFSFQQPRVGGKTKPSLKRRKKQNFTTCNKVCLCYGVAWCSFCALDLLRSVSMYDS